MVEGTFSFLLFLFVSPQQAITNQFAGYWEVTLDNTVQARDWNRIYYFEKCSKKDLESLECGGYYGWAEFDGIYMNLYDKNYLTYGVEKGKDVDSGNRRLLLSTVYYDFVINKGQGTLKLYDPDTSKLVMEMKKVKKSKIRRSKGS